METISKIRYRKFIKKVNPDLDKYTNMNIFKDKVEEAKNTIKKTGVPKLP